MARYGFLSFRSADGNGLYTFPFPFLPAGHPPFSIPAFPPHSALQPSGTYFAAKVSGRHNPANAGIPLGRENLPLRCRAYFPVQPWPGVPADFSEQHTE